MDLMYWEDFHVGQRVECGGETVSREDILAFAQKFDPQPQHIDEQAAERGPYGGLIASGWQTGALCMQMMVKHLLSRTKSMGSPGIDQVRWRQPVRPGDTLHVRLETLSKSLHPRRPRLGFVNNHFEVFNQRDQVVMSMRSTGMFLLREAITDGPAEAQR